MLEAVAVVGGDIEQSKTEKERKRTVKLHLTSQVVDVLQ